MNRRAYHAKKKAKRLAPYRRLEAQLHDTQNALTEAATAYTVALQALTDLLHYYDHPPAGFSPNDEGKKFKWIRAVADGNSASYAKFSECDNS